MLASYNRLAALRLNSCTQLVLVVEEMLDAVGVPVFARDSARVVERGPVGRVALKLDGDDHTRRVQRAPHHRSGSSATRFGYDATSQTMRSTGRPPSGAHAIHRT